MDSQWLKTSKNAPLKFFPQENAGGQIFGLFQHSVRGRQSCKRPPGARGASSDHGLAPDGGWRRTPYGTELLVITQFGSMESSERLPWSRIQADTGEGEDSDILLQVSL